MKLFYEKLNLSVTKMNFVFLSYNYVNSKRKKKRVKRI